jgi:hypothetical protein
MKACVRDGKQKGRTKLCSLFAILENAVDLNFQKVKKKENK